MRNHIVSGLHLPGRLVVGVQCGCPRTHQRTRWQYLECQVSQNRAQEDKMTRLKGSGS